MRAVNIVSRVTYDTLDHLSCDHLEVMNDGYQVHSRRRQAAGKTDETNERRYAAVYCILYTVNCTVKINLLLEYEYYDTVA